MAPACKRIPFIFALAIFLLASKVFASPPPASISWQEITEGFKLAKVRLYPNSFFSPELLFINLDLRHFRIASVRGIDFGEKNSTVKKLAKVSKALVGINANFFDEKKQPLGLVMSHGQRHNPIHRGGKTLTGIFQVTRSGAAVVKRTAFSYSNVIEAIQAGPRLINGGKAIGGQKGAAVSSRRAGICVVDPERVMFYISSGLIGVTLSDLQALLLDPKIACNQALNLDGGGSAQLFISANFPAAKTSLQEIVIHGSDTVPVMLGVFARSSS